MKVNNEQIKAACIQAATQKDIHQHRNMMTLEQATGMSQRILISAAQMYDQWLQIEQKAQTNNPEW